MFRKKIIWAGLVILIILVVFPGSLLVGHSLHIQELRKLTILPTIESEPNNRASYYLAAADMVRPVDLPPPTSSSVTIPVEPLGENELEPPASASLGEESIDWSWTEPRVTPLLNANRAALEQMKKTWDIEGCRMPLLYYPGSHGGGEFTVGRQLRAVGELLFWSTLAHIRDRNQRAACEEGLINLRLGRDVALAGSCEQANVGMHIYHRALRALGALVTSAPLDESSLETLQAKLPDCGFPAGFGINGVFEHHHQWYALLCEDAWPLYPRVVTVLRLNRIIDIRRYNFSQPTAKYGQGETVEDYSVALSLLRIGIAAQQCLRDTGNLPASMEELAPECLTQVPDLPTGIQIVLSRNEDGVAIIAQPDPSNPQSGFRYARQSLRLSMAKLKTPDALPGVPIPAAGGAKTVSEP